MLLELPLALALIVWARWLGGKYGAPRWVRWVGWSCAGVWLLTAVGSTVGFVRGNAGAVRAESLDAAQKARVLAEGISEALHWALHGAGILAGGAVALLALTWRHHWSAKPPVVPREPPYR